MEINSLDKKSSSGQMKFGVFIAIVIGAVLLGIGAGFLGSSTTRPSTGPTTADEVQSTKSEGVFDKKRFPDKAEGKMKEGGIEGEGSFHLVRPGGNSQNVYLTSSIVDLSKYLGQKVRVWGETQKAQKAGWLMDVGYVEKL